MTQYSGADLAPYYRFRPTPFYDTVFPNGTYTADIAGRNWTCEHCWSKYGWRGLDVGDMSKGGEFTSDEVATKLMKGMERNLQPMCRISGGEASMHSGAAHGRRHPRRARAHPGPAHEDPGRHRVRRRRGHGHLHRDQRHRAVDRPAQRLEEEFGEEARRIVLAIGMKA